MTRGQAFRLQLLAGLAALALAVLGTAEASGATPTRVGSAQSLDQGPLLAGDALAYTQATNDRSSCLTRQFCGAFSVRVVRRGARPAVLARGSLLNREEDTTYNREFVTLGASAQRLAYNDHYS